jgi:WXG100 family type VII secretion target
MSETQAQSAFMEQTANKFEHANSDLQTMLRNLLNELEVLQTAWVGRGGRSFSNVKEQWANDQAKLQQALVETAGAIRTSGQNYAATDDESASRMNNVSRGGPALPL